MSGDAALDDSFAAHCEGYGLEWIDVAPEQELADDYEWNDHT